MYCITIYDNHYEKINKLGFVPVGLGKNITSSKFQTDKIGKNISDKNPFYGEYTFHYWLWKNEIRKLDKQKWIGFCQYRKYWAINSEQNNSNNLRKLNENLLKSIPKDFDKYEAILGEPLFINQFKFTKFFKKNFFKIAKNPNLLFNKNNRNIKFHFDLMHGEEI